MTSLTDMAAQPPEERYVVVGDWLAVDVGECTCGTGRLEPHEPYCGVEPVAQISDLLAAYDAQKREGVK